VFNDTIAKNVGISVACGEVPDIGIQVIRVARHTVEEYGVYRDKTVAVVVPAYNEEKHIGLVFEGMPDFIDAIYAIDDASTDGTSSIVEYWRRQDPRIVLVRHEVNRGVGGAIVTGYKRALADGMDISVVMAGDNQMEPEYLGDIIDPVADGLAEYSKATRLTDRAHLNGMSLWRIVGNYTLRWLTVIATGNADVTDPQNGYTAVSKDALDRLDLYAVYPYYGYCNDLVGRLTANGEHIVEISLPSMYHGEVSKIRYHKYIPRVSKLLLRIFVLRVTGRLKSRNSQPTLDVVAEGTE